MATGKKKSSVKEREFKRFSQEELDLFDEAMERIIEVVGETSEKIYLERRKRRRLLSGKKMFPKNDDDLFYVLPMLIVLDCNCEEVIEDEHPICPN